MLSRDLMFPPCLLVKIHELIMNDRGCVSEFTRWQSWLKCHSQFGGDSLRFPAVAENLVSSRHVYHIANICLRCSIFDVEERKYTYKNDKIKFGDIFTVSSNVRLLRKMLFCWRYMGNGTFYQDRTTFYVQNTSDRYCYLQERLLFTLLCRTRWNSLIN